MIITDLKIKKKNKITVKDSLNAPLLKLNIKVEEDTIIPESNDLIIYIEDSNSNQREVTYTLSNKLGQNEEFIISPVFKGNDFNIEAYIKRNNGTTESVFYEPIILNEKENIITTNYTNCLIEVVYPKDTELVNYFLTNILANNLKGGSLTLDDIYFKDCFTETDEGINAQFNRLSVSCISSNQGNFSLDAAGNLTVNSIITANEPTGGSSIDFDSIYPIGSIYMSVNNVNPSTMFGGTWESWGAGKVPVGVNANETEFNTVEKTGGEKTHTLSLREMPIHNHAMFGYWTVAQGSYAQVRARSTVSGDPRDYDSAMDTAGWGEAHNNLQPYITCYMWKRTA